MKISRFDPSCALTSCVTLGKLLDTMSLRLFICKEGMILAFQGGSQDEVRMQTLAPTWVLF